jgi:hypothetical protein
VFLSGHRYIKICASIFFSQTTFFYLPHHKTFELETLQIIKTFEIEYGKNNLEFYGIEYIGLSKNDLNLNI